MRILVTGSRDWKDRDAVWDALDKAAQIPGITLVHGDCPTGADAMAVEWANCQPDVTLEPHPADWSLGRIAGPQRNKKMVLKGADICLAFIGPCTSPRCHNKSPHDSHGASGTALLAERAGIPVRRFRP